MRKAKSLLALVLAMLTLLAFLPTALADETAHAVKLTHGEHVSLKAEAPTTTTPGADLVIEYKSDHAEFVPDKPTVTIGGNSYTGFTLTEAGTDGYRKLTEFRDAYGALNDGILPYLNQWLMDYVVYYNLDAGLLADMPQVRFNRDIAVLDSIQSRGDEEVIRAVKQLSPKWLERSKFYREYREDCDTVIVRVLRRMAEHYDTRCKKTMVEQYFGSFTQSQVILFDSAVFHRRQEQGSRQYTVDEKYIYRCHNGLWSVQKYSCIPHSNGKLGDVLKAIDAVMRECYGYGRPIQYKLETKWIIKIIQEEAQNLLAEKKAAEEKKITIDYSRLARIRDDAAVTRDRLMVDEEAEEEAPPAQPPEPAAEPEDTPLTKDEYRLLQSLLYGRDYGWVRSSGLMLSVLVDGINDKLYDTFSDSVLLGDDPPELIEDYIADLKEMIHS